MWEQRHGFPEPQRLPSGHRRYSELDVALIRQVCADRDAGMSLAAAIVRARSARDEAHSSIFSAMRRMRPDLEPYTLPKRTLVALSHAIEDECLARAERPVLFASFQRERFYRDSEQRWRTLARDTDAAVVFADFDEARRPPGAPIELPIDRTDPVGREWSLVCDAREYCACLSGWEPPARTASATPSDASTPSGAWSRGSCATPPASPATWRGAAPQTWPTTCWTGSATREPGARTSCAWPRRCPTGWWPTSAGPASTAPRGRDEHSRSLTGEHRTENFLSPLPGPHSSAGV